MRVLRFASVLLLSGFVASATAQLLPTPITATVINFDDIPGASDLGTTPTPVLDPGQYANQGVVFTGFGNSGGIVVDYNFVGGGPPTLAVSLPNVLGFIGIASTAQGGLAVSPETLSFFPPITSLQFDVTTFNISCGATQEVLKVDAFDANGVSLGTQSVPLPLLPDSPPPDFQQGITISATFAAPGASKVVVAASSLCGLSPQLQLEAWSMDNVAFVSQPAGASKCTQEALDAAGKKAKAEASCNAKALQNGVPVDPACIQKAVDNFNKAFAKAQAAGDCQTDTDGPTVEADVDTLIFNAINLVTAGSPGPDVCFGKKLTSIGKKAQSITKCYSKAAKSGVVADEACGQKAANSFNGSLKKCGTPTQLLPVESLVDQFGSQLNRSLSVPTTTTTTTTTSTTTTTLPPPLGEHLSFTTTPGTANCGSGQLSTPPDPPLSGELDSDLVGTKIVDLGLGCLYIGGGNSAIAASNIPENATTILDTSDGSTLTASFGTGRADCSKGPQSSAHCLNSPGTSCTSDADCGGAVSACAPDANCFFGPPVEVNGFPPTCVVNAFAQDATGTLNLATGESSVSINLASRVYLTIGQPSTCPHCDGGACNWGDNVGGACTTTNSQGTTLDCPPSAGVFLATLPVDLTPLSSGTNVKQAADGLFCSGQFHAGAFGQPTTQAIVQNGSPGGDLSDGQPHASVLVSNFCIPPTGNAQVDGIGDLPGPGSLSLGGNAQFFASPSGAFLN